MHRDCKNKIAAFTKKRLKSVATCDKALFKEITKKIVDKVYADFVKHRKKRTKASERQKYTYDIFMQEKRRKDLLTMVKKYVGRDVEKKTAPSKKEKEKEKGRGDDDMDLSKD